MISVLAIELQVLGFKPGRCNGFFSAIQTRSTPSLRGEVKAVGPMS
jgi:hypothetical protein